MLECSGLTKTYRKECVVDNLSFHVKEGEVFALLGSNGAGKTTTIKMILKLVKQDGGRVIMREGVCVSYSPETPYFPPFLSGCEALMYYGRVQGFGKDILKEEAGKLLATVGLEETHTKIKHYSKGMLQRLALAQALLGNPKLLILDEPTAGMDALGRVEMMQLIGRLKNQGKTILLNSHILNDIERVCDRGVVLKKGKLIATWDKNKDYGGKNLEEYFIEQVGGMES
ncbi:MAG: ABC transporter ATP-binding protein [Lachnospiraceae bacterium]|nr:ABC transporter ATP-binding protein [Lachnospiraceae bacterium]